ncbi:hypothetical protein KM043_001605 [Ampulex compressa]|nr:hypothetical protein KM043_001605 [Ampulex compressa]
MGTGVEEGRGGTRVEDEQPRASFRESSRGELRSSEERSLDAKSRVARSLGAGETRDILGRWASRGSHSTGPSLRSRDPRHGRDSPDFSRTPPDALRGRARPGFAAEFARNAGARSAAIPKETGGRIR